VARFCEEVGTIEHMQRRDFMTLLGGAATPWPLAARGQQPRKVWRIGFLSTQSRPVALEPSRYGGFLQGMRELGHVEGRDFVMEWRFAEGRPELYPVLAAELVSAMADVIVVTGGALIAPVQQASSTAPIVMTVATDPVGSGIVASLARPGGSVTGLATSTDDTTPKQLQLLAQIAAPSLMRVGFLFNPDNVGSPTVLKNVQTAASTGRLQLVLAHLRNQQDVDRALTSLTKERVQALMVANDPVGLFQAQRIAEFAIANRLPTIFSQRDYVEAGGLMSYGESFRDFNRRAAFYVDKIMKGAKPADLPVQQPTRFFLTINRKTAEALGLSIPLELLVLADEIVE
jgi:putative ABC transport system substrate-binding protein